MFAGDGPLRRQMEEKAAALGVKDDILFLGVVEDIPALMQTFDVFAMPSLFEGLPLVLVEAQASGFLVLYQTILQRKPIWDSAC